jgi:hypothetical protein
MDASCRNGPEVVTPCAADYHRRMPGDAGREVRVVQRAGSAGRVVLRADGRGDSEAIVEDAEGRVVERIEMRPSLFAGLHRPFALGAGERLAARALLALLRLPGGAKLLRGWHARRGA